MRWIPAETVEAKLDYPRLISALKDGFANGATMPPRMRYEVSAVSGANLFTMPCWREGAGMTVKIMTSYPGNAQLGRSTSSELLAFFDEATGELEALIDGKALTNRRTAATSALASSFLSRPDSRTLAVLGTGRLARHMVEGHCSVRPIRRVLVWGRQPDKAATLAADLRTLGIPAEAAEDLRSVTSEADIITAVTRATTPIVMGQSVRPGTHIDLVGGYKRDMREADDAAAARSRIFVDQYETALTDPGDIVQPLESGTITRASILGDLCDLVTGKVDGRRSPDDVTLFKSVGCGLEDLYAAKALIVNAEA